MNQYREGKVKRTPVRGVKEYLKPYTYKQWEGYAERWIGGSAIGEGDVDRQSPDHPITRSSVQNA